jgi:hypothetical protein
LKGTTPGQGILNAPSPENLKATKNAAICRVHAGKFWRQDPLHLPAIRRSRERTFRGDREIPRVHFGAVAANFGTKPRQAGFGHCASVLDLVDLGQIALRPISLKICRCGMAVFK